MNQSNAGSAASLAVEKTKNVVLQQIERQAHVLGERATETAHDLDQVGSQLRESGMISSAAQLIDWAAGYVRSAGTYLESGSMDSFIEDLESVGRERPWAIAASVAAIGFAAARVIKSSSFRRMAGSGNAVYGGGYESDAVDTVGPPRVMQ